MGESIDYDLEEAKILQTGYLKIYEIYFHWFTWFFGVDILSMSWVLTSEKPLHGTAFRIVMTLWLLCTGLGLGASWLLHQYTAETTKRFTALVSGKLRVGSAPTDLGLRITRYACKATAAALALTFPAWLLLLYNFG